MTEARETVTALHEALILRALLDPLLQDAFEGSDPLPNVHHRN